MVIFATWDTWADAKPMPVLLVKIRYILQGPKHPIRFGFRRSPEPAPAQVKKFINQQVIKPEVGSLLPFSSQSWHLSLPSGRPARWTWRVDVQIEFPQQPGKGKPVIALD
jgi:hypothetical protein